MITIFHGRISDKPGEALMSEIKRLSHTKVYLIVPEQLSMKREYAVNRDRLKNVTVLNMSRLANEIFRTYGGAALKSPDGAMNAAAVEVAINRVYSKLVFYKSIAKKPGFISKLISAFNDFDMNCMSLEALMALPESEIPPRMIAKYRDMFLIYDEYKQIWEGAYHAPGDEITIAAGMLELHPFFESAVVMFDGFHGFTPQQYTILEQILIQAHSCFFSFTTDLEDGLFSTVTGEVNYLIRLCKKHGLLCSLQRTSAEKRGLYMLEQAAFHPIHTANVPNNMLTVYKASDPSDEITFISCKIKNDVLDGKYRYRDIAILAPNADSIQPSICAAFKKHGIPLFSDTDRTVMTKPLCALVLYALETVNLGFEYENVFSLLKTGLFGMDFDDISIIENYVRIWKIRGKAWSKERWTQNPAGLVGLEVDKKRLDKINELKDRIFLPLDKFKTALKNSNGCRDMLTAIVSLLDDLCVQDNLKACARAFYDNGDLHSYNEYVRIYDIFIEMLESIDYIYGESKINVDRLTDIITVAALNTTVTGAPACADEVLFSALGRVRLEDIKCVYIIRMNGHLIPAPSSDSSLITDADKRIFNKYGIRTSMDFSASAMRERFDLYSAMFSASHELVLTFPEFDGAGAKLETSIFVDNIVQKTNTQIKTHSDMAPEFYLVSIAAASELAFTGHEVIDEVIFDLTGLKKTSFERHGETLSDNIVSGLYSKRLKLSFSGIEEYVSCPFKFFLDRGLRLRQSEPVEFDAANTGTFIHYGLEHLLSGKYDILGADDNTISHIANEITNEYYNSELADCKNRSARFDYLFSRAGFAFKSAAQNVVKEIQSSEFRPFAFELDISESMPPFELKSGYSLSLTGKIDRVDMTPNGSLAKIIDYKSGKKKFSIENIYNGISLQLPIYSAAVRSQYENVKIAAMYYFKVGMPDIFSNKDIYKGLTDAQYEKKIEDCYKRDGIYSSDEDVVSRIDPSGRFFSKRSQSDKIDELIDFAMEKVKEIGSEITSGSISVSPLYEENKLDACKYCDYKSICKRTDSTQGVRTLSTPPKDFLEKDGE